MTCTLCIDASCELCAARYVAVESATPQLAEGSHQGQAVSPASDLGIALGTLSGLLAAFPQLRAAFSTTEQQIALTRAYALLEKHGRDGR